MTHEEQVLIRGKVFLYKQKAPFVPSGKSVLGALEYRESDDKVRCHECGEWHRVLTRHIRSSHQLSPREYKGEHGLNQQAVLCGPTLSSTFSAKRTATNLKTGLKPGFTDEQRSKGHRTKRERAAVKSESRLWSEARNENGTCQAQLLSRIRSIADRVGRTPTSKELEQAGISRSSAFVALNVSSLNQLTALAGLMPRDAGCAVKTRKIPRDLLVEMLRDFYVKFDRLPTVSDVMQFKLIPSYTTFCSEFGSMEAAYDAAGLGRVYASRKAGRITEMNTARLGRSTARTIAPSAINGSQHSA